MVVVNLEEWRAAKKEGHIWVPCLFWDATDVDFWLVSRNADRLYRGKVGYGSKVAETTPTVCLRFALCASSTDDVCRPRGRLQIRPQTPHPSTPALLKGKARATI